MNAPALNTAAMPSQGQAASAAAAPVASPLAGFEALLAALLPQDATVGVAGAKAPAGSAAVTAKSAEALKESSDDAEAEPAILASDNAAGDANSALLASLLAGQPAVAEAATAAGKPASESVVGSPGSNGRTRAAAAPSFADRTAFVPDSPEPGPQIAPDETDFTASPPVGGGARQETSTPAASPALQGASAGPRNPPATADAPPPPLAQAVTADIPDVPPPVTQAEAPAVEPTPVATAGLPPPPIAAPPARPEPPGRATRAERARAATDAGAIDAPPGLARAAPPGLAKAGPGTAASPEARVDRAEPAVAEADSELSSESPDGVLQADTKATAQSLTPAAHASHAVRGSPETVANLAAQIVKKLEGKSTRFDLELNPAGLGRVDVRLEIGAQGRITAAMTFDSPQAASELKARASELQQALEQAGFDMSGGMSFDVAGDRGQQQRQAWQDQNDSNGEAFRGRAFRAALDTAGDAADTAVSGALRLRRGVNAGLDLRI